MLISEYLSNVELYFSEESIPTNGSFAFSGEEVKHITKVMRHSVGDVLYFTSGLGSIVKTEISFIEKYSIELTILEEFHYTNPLEHITLCLPMLRSKERMEFAIEKAVELGFTSFQFIAYDSTVKKEINLERVKKITQSALTQSLRAYLPKLGAPIVLSENVKLAGTHIVFDQSGMKQTTETLRNMINKSEKIFLYFGPEGGFSQREFELFRKNKSELVKLTENRLRAETAILSALSIIAIF